MTAYVDNLRVQSSMHQRSSFFLYSNSSFKLHTVEIGYLTCCSVVTELLVSGWWKLEPPNFNAHTSARCTGIKWPCISLLILTVDLSTLRQGRNRGA